MNTLFKLHVGADLERGERAAALLFALCSVHTLSKVDLPLRRGEEARNAAAPFGFLVHLANVAKRTRCNAATAVTDCTHRRRSFGGIRH